MKRIILVFIFISLFAPLAAFASSYGFQTPVLKEFNQNFKFICNAPCPYTKEQLKKIKHEAFLGYLKLKRLIKTDLPKEILPIEIRLGPDEEICTHQIPNSGYAIRNENGQSSIICDYIVYFANERIFKRVKPKKKVKPNAHLAHEILHLYFPEAFTPESKDKFEHPLIYSVEALIKSPHIFKNFCHSSFGNKGSYKEVIYKLCTEAGFDINHVPALMKKIVKWGKDNPDKSVKLNDYLNMLKEILGQDVSRFFE